MNWQGLSIKEHGLFEDVLLEFGYDSILHLIRNLINDDVSNEWVAGQKLGTVTWLRMYKGVVYFELSLILQVKGTTEIVWYKNYVRGRLSWVGIPTGTRDFLLQNHPVLLRGPTCFLLNGSQGSLLVLRGRGVKLTTHLLLRLRMGGTFFLCLWFRAS